MKERTNEKEPRRKRQRQRDEKNKNYWRVALWGGGREDTARIVRKVKK